MRLNTTLSTLLLALCWILCSTTAFAQTTYTWTGGGTDPTDWQDNDNWNPNTGYPNAGDTAQFTSGSGTIGPLTNIPNVTIGQVTLDGFTGTVEIDGSESLNCTNLTINTGTLELNGANLTVTNITIGTAGTLSRSTFGNQTITGNIVQNGTMDLLSGGTTFFSGTTTVSGTGDVDLTTVTVSGSGSLTLGSNNFNVQSSMTVQGTANLTMGSGKLSVNSLTIGSGTGSVSLNNGTIEFTGSGNRKFIFDKNTTLPINNLTVNKTSGSLEFQGTGTNTFQINGTFELKSNTSLSLDMFDVDVIAYNGASSTLKYNFSGNRDAGVEWPTTNLPSNVEIDLDNPSNTLTLLTNQTIPRDLKMTQGILALGTNTLTISGSLASSSVSGSATISASSVDFTTNEGVVVFGNGTSSQSDQTITGNVTISALVLNKDVSSGNILSVSGSPTISSGVRIKAGTLKLTGSTTISNGGLELLTGATTATPTVQIGESSNSGTLTISSGGYTQQAGTTTLSNGTLTISSGGYTQQAGTTTLNGGTFSVTASGTLTVNSGSFIVTSGANAVTIGTLSLGPGATYRTGGKPITSLSSFNANSTSNFVYDGTSSESFLQLTTATYGNVEIANTAGNVTVPNTSTAIVQGTLSFTVDSRVITGPNANAGTLRIDANGSISGANSNRFVDGPLERVINSNSAFQFPVGTSTAFRPATLQYSNFTGSNLIIRVRFDAGALPGWEQITGTSNTSAKNGFYEVTQVSGTLPTYTQFNFTGRYTTANFSPKSRARMVRQIAPQASNPTYELLTTVTNNQTTDDLEATLSALPTNDGYIGFADGGAQVRWDGGGGNQFWTTPANWDGDQLPSSLDDVILDNQHVIGSYTVNLNNSTVQEIQSLTIDSGTDPGDQITLQLTDANAQIKLLSNANALTVLGNDVITLQGSNSFINNQGGGSISFNTSSTFNIASTNSGALLLANYGTLNITNTSGTISVTGNVQAQTAFSKSGAGVASITGDLTAPTITQSGGTLSVTGTLAGNFNLNGGTFTPGTSTAFTGSTLTFGGGALANSGRIRFNGTAAQTISGSGTFYELEVDNANGVTMNDNITVSNNLILTNGNITTGSNTLTFSNTATTLTGSASSFVDGRLSIAMPTGNATRFFPVGKAVGGYRPVEITQASATSSTVVRVEMKNTAPTPGSLAGLNNISSVRYYEVTVTNGSVTNPQVKLTFDPTETVNNTATLVVARSSDNNNWTNAGQSAITSGSGPPYTGNITSNPTNFDTVDDPTFFALGSSAPDNPLPVQLSSFTLTPRQRSIELVWQTESESENRGFIILRSESATGGYQEIASYLNTPALVGQGTTSSPTRYRYLDSHNLQPGRAYWYKLVDVDFSGRRYEHEPMSVQTAFEYALDQNYPNPFNPTTAIQFSLEKPGKTVLEIYNTLGQKVATLVNGELSAGAHRYQWNASGLASGVYFYRLQSNEFVATKKMLLVK